MLSFIGFLFPCSNFLSPRKKCAISFTLLKENITRCSVFNPSYDSQSLLIEVEKPECRRLSLTNFFENQVIFWYHSKGYSLV